MPKEKRLLAAFTPEVDGIRERVNGLLVAADERAAEVDAFQVVFFGLQVGDLANVVTARRHKLVHGWISDFPHFVVVEGLTLSRIADFVKCPQARTYGRRQ